MAILGPLSTLVDLYKTISDLLEERRRLDALILRLERTQANEVAKTHLTPRSKKKRGRKSMSSDERREVSERMRKYWAERRTSGGHALAASEATS